MTNQLPRQISEALSSGQTTAIDAYGMDCFFYRKGSTGGDPFYWDVPVDYWREVRWGATEHVGDASQNTFSGALPAPLHEGVVFSDGIQKVRDTDPGVSINYDTGHYKISFPEPPSNRAPITASYITEAPVKTKVWFEVRDPKKFLPDVGFGSFHEDQLPLIAYLPADLEAKAGEYFEIPVQFVHRGKQYGSQFQIVGRSYQGLDRQSLTSYEVAPRRDSRPPTEDERRKEELPPPKDEDPPTYKPPETFSLNDAP